MLKRVASLAIVPVLVASSHAAAFDPKFDLVGTDVTESPTVRGPEAPQVEWMQSINLDTNLRSDLLVSFGEDGLYVFYNDTEWKLLLPVAPRLVWALELDNQYFREDPCTPDPNTGLCWEWTRLPELLVDLEEDGVYIFRNGATWEFFLDRMPQHLLMTELDNRLFRQPDPYFAPDADCSGSDPETQGCVAYPKFELVISDGPGPVRVLYNGTEWRNLGDAERSSSADRTPRSRQRDRREQFGNAASFQAEITNMGR